MTISFTKSCDYSIAALLYFLLIFSPFAFGGVQIFPLTIIESASFFILFIWQVKRISGQPSPISKASFWIPAILFLFLVNFQLAPLPRVILGSFSSKHLYIFTTFIPAEALPKAQYCLTVCKASTVHKLFELLSYLSVFFVLLNILETKKQLEHLILLIIAMGFLVSIIGMANNFTYPFINKNHFAGYMEMTSFLAVGYLLTGLDKRKRIIFSFVAIVMILGLFLSLSRGGLLCFLFSLGIMFYLLRLRKAIRRKSLLIAGIIAFTFLFMIIVGAEPFLERVSTIFKKETVSADARWNIWKDTLRIIPDFPLFGAGFGTFRNIYPMYKTFIVQASVLQAHNDFLQLISETGFLGLALAFWFLYSFFKNVFVAWQSQHHPFIKGIVLGGGCGVLSLLLHSFFDFNLQIPANALLLVVLMAVVWKSANIKKEGQDVNIKSAVYP